MYHYKSVYCSLDAILHQSSGLCVTKTSSVGSNKHVLVRDKCFDKHTTSNEKVHARFESLKFHSWTGSSLIILIIED